MLPVAKEKACRPIFFARGLGLDPAALGGQGGAAPRTDRPQGRATIASGGRQEPRLCVFPTGELG
jgi:hypothetical protein